MGAQVGYLTLTHESQHSTCLSALCLNTYRKRLNSPWLIRISSPSEIDSYIDGLLAGWHLICCRESAHTPRLLSLCLLRLALTSSIKWYRSVGSKYAVSTVSQ